MKLQTIKLAATTLALMTLGFGIGLYFYSADNNNTSISDRQGKVELNDNRANINADNLPRTAANQSSEQEEMTVVEKRDHADHPALTVEGDIIEENESSVEIAQDSAEAIAGEEVDLATATLNVDQLMANVDFQASTDYGVSDKTRDELTRLVGEDPLANERVLEAYLADPHSGKGEVLGMILSEFKDANIEAAALAMTKPGNDARDRLAGIEMLQRMGIENSETLQAALQIVNEETDTQLVNVALDTLQHQAVSTTQNQAIRETILPRLGDADPEVRRRSVIAYSDWVTNADAAAPIIQALNDPSVDVRAGAAFAISKVSAKSIEMRDALVQKVRDDEESWDVREQAWHALESHDMDEISYQVYVDFQTLRDTHGEAVK